MLKVELSDLHQEGFKGFIQVLLFMFHFFGQLFRMVCLSLCVGDKYFVGMLYKFYVRRFNGFQLIIYGGSGRAARSSGRPHSTPTPVGPNILWPEVT